MTTPKAPKPRKRNPKQIAQAEHIPGALAIRPDLAPAGVNPLAILVDCSISMRKQVNGLPAYEHARAALATLNQHGKAAIVFGFSTFSLDLHTIADIKPQGCTRLASTLIRLIPLNPRKVIVITDGDIDDFDACREIILAEMLDIDGIYIGNSTGDRDHLAALIAPGIVTTATPDMLGQTLLLTSGE